VTREIFVASMDLYLIGSFPVNISGCVRHHIHSTLGERTIRTVIRRTPEPSCHFWGRTIWTTYEARVIRG
jgi:hypothetical protein